MKKIGKWFLGFCLVMVIFSMAVVGALVAGIIFLGYKAYQEYQVNKFSNKFKAECAGVIALSLILIGIYSGNTDTTSTTETSTVKQEETVAEKKEDNIPMEYKQALKQAESYLNTMSFSKKGLYDQLTSEYGGQFTEEAAQYAIDNIKVDWKEQALKQAQSYLDTMSFSKQGLYDQLTSEYGGKFTSEEAQYAVDIIYGSNNKENTEKGEEENNSTKGNEITNKTDNESVSPKTTTNTSKSTNESSTTRNKTETTETEKVTHDCWRCGKKNVTNYDEHWLCDDCYLEKIAHEEEDEKYVNTEDDGMIDGYFYCKGCGKQMTDDNNGTYACDDCLNMSK